MKRFYDLLKCILVLVLVKKLGVLGVKGSYSSCPFLCALVIITVTLLWGNTTKLLYINSVFIT